MQEGQPPPGQGGPAGQPPPQYPYYPQPGGYYPQQGGPQPSGYYPQPGPQPGAYGYQQPGAYYQQQYAPASNGVATAAGIIGIVSIFIFGVILGILAIVLGFIGLGRARRLGGTGHGMALTGIICGFIGIIAWIIIVIYILNIRSVVVG